MASIIETLRAAGGQISMASPLGYYYQQCALRQESTRDPSLSEVSRTTDVAPGTPLGEYNQSVAIQADSCVPQPLSELSRNLGVDTPLGQYLLSVDPQCVA